MRLQSTATFILFFKDDFSRLLKAHISPQITVTQNLYSLTYKDLQFLLATSDDFFFLEKWLIYFMVIMRADQKGSVIGNAEVQQWQSAFQVHYPVTYHVIWI